MKNLWIKDGHLLDPANHRDEICDLYIKDGKVVSLDSLLSDKSAKEFQDNTTIIDAKGKYVMPDGSAPVLSGFYCWLPAHMLLCR